MKMVAAMILLLCLSNSLFALDVEELNLITEEYPPFNFTEDGRLQGFATDTLIEMLKIVDSDPKKHRITSLFWAQGYNLALKKKNTLLFSMARTDSRENLFKWVGPIVRSEIVVLAPIGDNYSLKSLEEINSGNYRIGVVINDVGELLLLEQGVNRKNIHRFINGHYLTRSLSQGKLDMLAYERKSALWNLNALGDQQEYGTIYNLKKVNYYYALNKKTDDQVITELQKALNQLRKSGALDIIADRYAE